MSKVTQIAVRLIERTNLKQTIAECLGEIKDEMEKEFKEKQVGQNYNVKIDVNPKGYNISINTSQVNFSYRDVENKINAHDKSKEAIKRIVVDIIWENRTLKSVFFI